MQYLSVHSTTEITVEVVTAFDNKREKKTLNDSSQFE